MINLFIIWIAAVCWPIAIALLIFPLCVTMCKDREIPQFPLCLAVKTFIYSYFVLCAPLFNLHIKEEEDTQCVNIKKVKATLNSSGFFSTIIFLVLFHLLLKALVHDSFIQLVMVLVWCFEWYLSWKKNGRKWEKIVLSEYVFVFVCVFFNLY